MTTRSPTVLRACSIRQPWAHAILHLGKDVENRTRRTHARERIAVHAPLTVDRDAVRLLTANGYQLPAQPPTGCVLGTVAVTGCVADSDSPWAESGAWHWQLPAPRVLTRPVPCRGALGLFTLPSNIVDAVHATTGQHKATRCLVGSDDLDRRLEAARADGQITTGGADTVREFAEFLRAAGPPGTPVPIEALRDHQELLGLSDEELAHAERNAAIQRGSR